MLFNRFSLLKQAKHQQFEFTPRYYDPVKEELNARIKKAKAEAKQEEYSQERKQRLSKQFRLIREQNKFAASRQKTKSNIRVIFILGLLSYICYKILTAF